MSELLAQAGGCAVFYGVGEREGSSYCRAFVRKVFKKRSELLGKKLSKGTLGVVSCVCAGGGGGENW